MSTQATQSPAAQVVAESQAISAAIDTIVGEMETAQSQITGVRPPDAELVEEYLETLDRLKELRGRGEFYPYIGSGMGRGALVELADGSVKWDLINGIGVHMFGHGDLDLVATALRAALGDTVMQGNLQCNADALQFAELLVEEAAASSRIRHCFVTNSGAMANESALKIAMQKHEGRAPRVLAFSDCFMGRSLTMAQIGDNPAGRAGLPLSTLVDYIPFYEPERGGESTDYARHRLLECIDRHPGQHACFVMELVQGEGGFNVAPREFLETLMQECRERGIAVWADEVQTFGRTNRMYHFDHLNLGEYVDIATIGKMSQVCACLYTEAYNPRPGLLSGTFIGSTVGLQTGRRMLERLRDGDYYGDGGRIEKLFIAFCEHARAIVQKHPDWFPPIAHPDRMTRVASGYFGGIGGMMRLTPFGGEKEAILALLHRMYDLGVIAFYCGHGPYHVRFLPPVGVLEPGDFEAIFEIVESAMAEVAGEMNQRGSGSAS